MDDVSIPELISDLSSGVARITLTKNGKRVGTGTGFIVDGKLLTNSHVLRDAAFDHIDIDFGPNTEGAISSAELDYSELIAAIQSESDRRQFDYAFISLDTDIVEDRHHFELDKSHSIEVGSEVLFFGFPFSAHKLTSHMGRISTEYELNSVHRYQIDGSINPGNSGGPLIDISTGKVIGVVTKTQTGLQTDLDKLATTLDGNVKALSNQGAVMTIGGVDPVQATRATMAAILEVTVNLKHSANVGIGYAYCVEHHLESPIFN